MKKPFTTFRVGARTSNLSLAQTRMAAGHLEKMLPGWTFEIRPQSSPGDRDRMLDLRASPDDFFTRDLDEAILRGELDFAMHSAKDMPDPMTQGLDWFWLPWREDPRDCLVLPAGKTLAELPSQPRIGISSERRAAYGQARFPRAQLLPIRGNIEDRLAQLDAGRFDILIMAGAALLRLGLASRIGEWIARSELHTPPGQGALGVSFRVGDARLIRLRSLVVRPVSIVGAGAGHAGLCTADGLAALRTCDVCIHDALLDSALLDETPAGAERIDAGKRAGDRAHAQAETTAWILRHARRGRRVVRLKGGDPGIFGRLAEETEALETLGLPFRVIPGVSSLNAATTGTGMLLTRRSAAPGFCAITARAAGDRPADVSAAARSRLPVVFFMAGNSAAAVTEQLQRDGWNAATPAAAVFGAGTDDERIVSGTLENLDARMAEARLAGAGSGAGSETGGREAPPNPPALLICGDVAGYRFRNDCGALRGKRVLLTFSAALLAQAVQGIREYGGIPVVRPMVRLTPCLDECGWLRQLPRYDWAVLTSPSAVDCLVRMLRQAKVDLRGLPRVLVSGPGTAAQLEVSGLLADAQPTTNLGTEGLLQCARHRLRAGERVLRLRSDRAGAGLAEALRDLGLHVDDVVLYRNEPVCHAAGPPRFDMAVFGSGSEVESLLAQWNRETLAGKVVAAFPGSAGAALATAGVPVAVEASEPVLETCIRELALHEVRRALEEQT
jgi:uroporphyrinogen III methyltransferase/synthase